MPGYFFDSSALVKFYHAESGTATVDKIVRPAGNVVRIARLTVAEMTSAFAIKVRTRSISRSEADTCLLQFLRDVVAARFGVYSVGDSEFAMAEWLIGRYAFDFRLRTLDAIQLAVALELRHQGLIDHFVVADSNLCEVAQLEGLSVMNPEL